MTSRWSGTAGRGRESIEWTLDSEKRIVTIVFRGRYSFRLWRGAVQAVFAHADYEPGFGFLLDRRDATPPTTADVLRMVRFMDQNRDSVIGSRWAFLTSGPADYGMVRMTEGLAFDQPTELEAFVEEREALAWLLGEPGTGRLTG